MNNFFKRTWAEIDLNALEYNYNTIKKRVGNSKLMCVIKADAYGHGAVKCAKEYEQLGADWFAVSNIEEALQLRQNGITTNILILGYTPESCAALLSRNNISQAVFSLDYALALSQQAKKEGATVKCHIKLDTGMSRIGFSCQSTSGISKSVDEIATACKLEGIISEGVFTHFATSDDGDKGKEFTLRQLECFNKTIELLKNKNIEFSLHHCANSGAIADYPQAYMDMVRAGIILYGLDSSELNYKLDLQPVMKVKSVVSHIKTVPSDTTVSYGRKYTTSQDTVLATVPIGYADGYSRLLSNTGHMYVNGQIATIAGRVCMDQTIINVTGLGDIKRGDEVTVFGNKEIPTDMIAQQMGTINYEVVCLIGKRVPRVYIKDEQIQEISNGLI